MRRLPPLNALRAFEAAARHLHIARAAGELNVTHGAVSHQIRHLEESLGTALLARTGNRIALTPAGQRLLPVLSESLDRIAEATAGLAHDGAAEQVTIACAPALAAKWLVPEMTALLERHPGVAIDIAPAQELAWFDPRQRASPREADIVIAYGRPDAEAVGTVPLPGISFFPVMSPRLSHGARAVRRPQDIARHAILHDDDGTGWRRWMAAAGLEGSAELRHMRLGNASLSLGAAVDGLGIALGDTILADADLAAGRLVAPFEIRVPAPGAYFLMLPQGARRPGAREAVATWLADRLSARMT